MDRKKWRIKSFLRLFGHRRVRCALILVWNFLLFFLLGSLNVSYVLYKTNKGKKKPDYIKKGRI